MIPERLQDWNFDVIKELVEKNSGESDSHDFKFNLPNADTLSKICCAFANTKGGFVILGIKEEKSKFKIKGIKNDKELAHKFGQKRRATPTIWFSLPKIIHMPSSDRILAVFHIPLSSKRPHIPSGKEEQRKFYKRTNKGNEYMTYDEIRMEFQSFGERREKLKLLYLELLSNIEALPSIRETSKDSISVVTLDSAIIENLLVDLYTIVGKNTKFIRALFTIRNGIRVIKNTTQALLATLSIPGINTQTLISKHNMSLQNNVRLLRPKLEYAIKILEADFGLRNPLLPKKNEERAKTLQESTNHP